MKRRGFIKMLGFVSAVGTAIPMVFAKEDNTMKKDLKKLTSCQDDSFEEAWNNSFKNLQIDDNAPDPYSHLFEKWRKKEDPDGQRKFWPAERMNKRQKEQVLEKVLETKHTFSDITK